MASRHLAVRASGSALSTTVRSIRPLLGDFAHQNLKFRLSRDGRLASQAMNMQWVNTSNLFGRDGSESDKR
jgi:hypothetical protein